MRFIAGGGTTEFLKRWEPKRGDIVSFKHHGFLTSKKPKLPTLYRLRPDLTWAHVCDKWTERTPSVAGTLHLSYPQHTHTLTNNLSPTLPQQTTQITAWPLQRPISRHRPEGYWEDIENRKSFFLELAKEKGFDPYQPQNWYKVSPGQIARRVWCCYPFPLCHFIDFCSIFSIWRPED